MSKFIWRLRYCLAFLRSGFWRVPWIYKQLWGMSEDSCDECGPDTGEDEYLPEDAANDDSDSLRTE